MTTTRIVLTRLGLVAACSLWLLVLAVAWRFLGWQATVVAGLVGPLLAVGLSVETSPVAKDPRDR